MFGDHSNSVSREEFQAQLAFEGWKYFDMQSLNGLFALKYREQQEAGLISEVDQLEDHMLSEAGEASFLQPLFSIMSQDLSHR